MRCKGQGRNRQHRVGRWIAALLAAVRLKPFITEELRRSATPIIFRSPASGGKAFGFDATLLPQVCEVYLAARDANKLTGNQDHIAKACEILMRGLATVGIIALVDEATGYQDSRARDWRSPKFSRRS